MVVFMRRLLSILFLILGLSLCAPSSFGQARLEHWHTAGAGLSTPLGFNAGASYSVRVAGPVFVQAAVSATKDFYVTKHSVLAAGPAVGLRQYTDVALVSLSAGPTYVRGMRGLDLPGGGSHYSATSMTVTAQVLFREVNMGFELYTNVNPVRNVSGMRLIYRLGNIR